MTSITRGTGNVFADIGLPDPETHLVKAELVRRIGLVMAREGLSQAGAAERMGLSQPDVSKMLNGQFRPMSLERLIRCLVALGQTVTIDVGPPESKANRPELRVAAR